MLPSSRRLLVLDDDPTGSQCVAGVTAAFTQEAPLLTQALEQPGSTCFTLTNTRALSEQDAVELNRGTLGGVLREWGDDAAGKGLHVVSRSDSTLRGHVIAEPNALADELAAHGIPVDGFLFCPAMLEAGRFTEGDVHYAVVDGDPVPAGSTDFAQDATFGYEASNLREFLAEKSGGALRAEDVLSVSLEDVEQGADRVREVLEQCADRRWVVINATRYEHLETVADAVTALEAQGRVFVTRCAPSFVRPLAGQSGARLVDDAVLERVRADADGDRLSAGLLVVGSHVGLTTQQLGVVQERGGLHEVQIDVARVLDEEARGEHLDAVVAELREALSGGEDAAVYTSRTLVKDADEAKSLEIARRVSDAVVEVVRRVRSVRPAWVVAKGGITSHEVALNGLGIRAAEVTGQFFPGQISLFRPVDAPAEVTGCPYVVFPGNVGTRESLADVVQRLQGR
ncbi:four-carbon acid sugar kinase family protein [Rothia kristinae]|uniref:four-carbon acid sugar kinase family protein n=1 Tax=Rothia kristinae TaxID=37923 RepID=UPI000C266927|nr:four-carbon acid sugar kinase family protein [Rothia kristinae]MED6046156.1 four-carbon acid sugar kinase family protein [Rothia kristinae]